MTRSPSRSRRAWRGALVALLSSSFGFVGCRADTPALLPPDGQLLIYIDTDAPLPPAPGQSLGPNEPRPLFDRVRIDIFRPGESEPCGDCTHEFDIDRTLVGSGRASVGIDTPPRAPGYNVRVRMFRAAFIEENQPRPDATVEVTAALPMTNDEGITPVTIFLPTESVGVPIGSLDAPAQPILEAPAANRVGSWPGARRVDCAGAPRSQEVCIPGGAFWWGQPLLAGSLEQGDALAMRLVVLTPFFLDRTEVTVSEMRALQTWTSAPDDPMQYSLDDGKPGPPIHCTFTKLPGNNEPLPVNCISWERARAHCQARDADLPTEAQFQYVASGFEGHLYAWGNDPPSCADAVFARPPGFFSVEVRCPGAWLGPPGSTNRDRVLVEGLGARSSDEVVDLAGNVSEYALDLWNVTTESCWSRTGVYRDPVCTTPTRIASQQKLHSLLSGSFANPPGFLPAAYRRPAVSFEVARAAGVAGGEVYSREVTSSGFRCARPSTP